MFPTKMTFYVALDVPRGGGAFLHCNGYDPRQNDCIQNSDCIVLFFVRVGKDELQWGFPNASVIDSVKRFLIDVVRLWGIRLGKQTCICKYHF